MNTDLNSFSTGLPGLDRILCGLAAGDNVVWQVDTVDDYLPFVTPFWQEARRQNRKLVYFRFARHRELIADPSGGQVYTLRPEDGFERFLGGILSVIEKEGLGACYVFDWLSDLAADWYSDHMLGNFFRITCPYLFDWKTIAYFALKKNSHSFQATEAIHRTAQVILEVYRKPGHVYVHPQKVDQRYSPTLYLLHRWQGDQFTPVTNSAVITETLADVPQPWMDFSIHRPGVWLETFREAEATWRAVKLGRQTAAEADVWFQRVLKMVVTRDARFSALARRYFDLGDLIEIMKRMIGTGQIGGKTLGMLLARAILRRTAPRWSDRLESHDSFYIGSDVFYTYLVENGCWWLRRRQGDFESYLRQAAEARERILHGAFDEGVKEQFGEMLEYFGQSPIIVRSSSLLEDNYGNAFSGKYDSVFCANQGSPAQRLEAFIAAVRTVYASTLSPESLAYRQHHGLLDQDEQMGLLVQRVSGELYGRHYFPQVAGVGFSFNPFVWMKTIDPHAGFLRLVFGLGTRAVDRTDDDYTRLVALNEPALRPEGTGSEARQFGQRRADVLDLQANALVAREFSEVAQDLQPELLELFSEPHGSAPGTPLRLLDFDRMLAQTRFAPDMRELLRALETAYDNPVDIEFAANFLPDGQYRINLLQCRPFQVKIRGAGSHTRIPADLPPPHRLIESPGPIVGHSLVTGIHRLIYVVPAVYSQLPMSQRYSVARAIGRLTHLDHGASPRTIMLVGPGRWGTSMPSLGVPVSFAEINTVSVICELALMHEGLVPDVSLGTHFFNDLVEMDMLYFAVSPGRPGHLLNADWLQQQPNRLTELLPGSPAALADVLRVIDPGHAGQPPVCLNVDSMNQRALCYLDPAPATPAPPP